MTTGTMVSVTLLLVLVAFSGTLSSTEDRFYLSLGSISNSGGSGGSEGSGMTLAPAPDDNSTNNDTSDKCIFGPEIKVSCTCGAPLEEAQRAYREKLKETCDRFDEIVNRDSPFSFCTSTLRSDGWGYEIRKVSVSQGSIPVENFTDSSLNETVTEMEDRLRVFRRVLDRTISGVLAESVNSKCFCFVRVCS